MRTEVSIASEQVSTTSVAEVSSAPALTSISEETWLELQEAIATGAWERDTQTEILLHVVADERQPYDVRCRSLWAVSGRTVNCNLGFAVTVSEDGSFEESAITTLNQAFGTNQDLTKYGTELALRPFEDGSLKDPFEDPSSTAILLSASLPHIQSDPKLTARAIRAIVRHPYKQDTLGFRKMQLTETAARALLDPRVKDDIKDKIMQGLMNSDGQKEELEPKLKLGEVIRTAVDKYQAGAHDPTHLVTYFTNIYEQLSEQGILPTEAMDHLTFDTAHLLYELPAGMERIAGLEALLGSKHPYVQAVVNARFFNTIPLYPSYGPGYMSKEFLKTAESSALQVKDPDLKHRAHAIVCGINAAQLQKLAASNTRREAAKTTINRFFAYTHSLGEN